MATTLEDLEKRMASLEQEVTSLRQLVQRPRAEETPAERAARLRAQARQDKPRLRAVAAKAFAQMGIRGEPVSPDQLRAMMRACGIKPEDNLLSRGIIAMREE